MLQCSVQLLNAENVIPIDFHPRMKVVHEEKACRPTSVLSDAQRHVFLMETPNMFP